jgi:Na+/melibiose symporter-like transporter
MKKPSDPSNQEKIDRFSDLSEEERIDYEFTYRQLDTIDSKANNLLLVGSILIVISTLSILFSQEGNPVTQIIGTLAVVVTLLSVASSIWTMKIEFSFSIDIMEKVREKRKKSIHYSVTILFVALSLYVLMFLVDLAFRLSRA